MGALDAPAAWGAFHAPLSYSALIAERDAAISDCDAAVAAAIVRCDLLLELDSLRKYTEMEPRPGGSRRRCVWTGRDRECPRLGSHSQRGPEMHLLRGIRQLSDCFFPCSGLPMLQAHSTACCAALSACEKSGRSTTYSAHHSR